MTSWPICAIFAAKRMLRVAEGVNKRTCSWLDAVVCTVCHTEVRTFGIPPSLTRCLMDGWRPPRDDARLRIDDACWRKRHGLISATSWAFEQRVLLRFLVLTVRWYPGLSPYPTVYVIWRVPESLSSARARCLGPFELCSFGG